MPGVTPQLIERRILLVHGHKVMLDSDLALLYGVTTGNMNKAVTRNLRRFPSDFMFQLSREEYRSLSFQIGILKRGRHSKYLPRVFTEQGVAMLSSVLHSERAIQVNVEIMRAFVRGQFRIVFDAIRQLVSPPEQPSKPIGFRQNRKR